MNRPLLRAPLLLTLFLVGCAAVWDATPPAQPGVEVRRLSPSDRLLRGAGLAPEFAQALPLMGFDLAERHGHDGAGVGVLVIDFFGQKKTWGSEHGWAVVETLLRAAPRVEIWTIDLDQIIAELVADPVGALDPLLRALNQALATLGSRSYSVINMSLGYLKSSARCSTGTAYDSEINSALRALWARGVNVVTSSGNAGKFTPGYPACVPAVMAVGAVYDEDRERAAWPADERTGFEGCTDEPVRRLAVACFSHRSELYAVGAFADGFEHYTGHTPVAGTSLAAPFVSAAIALLRADGIGATEARQRLLDTAVVRYQDNLLYRVMDVAAALGLSAPEDTPLPPQPADPVAAAADANGDGRLDDAELLAALRAWVAAEPLGGVILSDSIIQRLLERWILEQPLSA